MEEKSLYYKQLPQTPADRDSVLGPPKTDFMRGPHKQELEASFESSRRGTLMPAPPSCRCRPPRAAKPRERAALQTSNLGLT